MNNLVPIVTHAQFVALQARVEQLESQLATRTTRKGERDYGPDSERKMDTMTALRILIGHWSNLTVRECADQHGLSRGQIYSLKGGYTMKPAHKIADAIRARRAI